MERNGHYAIDNGQTYCYDENDFDARVWGDTVVIGPQPDSFCIHCRTVDPEWIDITELEFGKLYN